MTWEHKRLSAHVFQHQQSHQQLQDALDNLASLAMVHLVHPAADDNFVTCRNICGQVLPSQHLVHTAAEDDIVICQKARVDKCLCCQVNVLYILQLMINLSPMKHLVNTL